MGTNTLTYLARLRPRVTFSDMEDNELYVFNAFNTSNPISIANLDMENAIGETGSFNMTINDHDNVFSKDHLHSVKVKLELGKTTSSFQHFMQGFSDVFSVDRPGTGAQFYHLTGFGTKIWAYQLYIHRRQKLKKGETDAKVWRIIHDALTHRKWRPLKTADDSIADITGWSDDGISQKVNTEYRIINKPLTKFGDLCDELCDITGAVWFIDYSSGSEVFTLTYNPDLMTNVIIKSGDLMDREHDNSARISYIKSAFGLEDNTTTESGTATRLLTTTVIDDEKIFELDDNDGFLNTTYRAIAQQVVIDNDARRIQSIELLLSKNGDPSSPNDRLNGDICLDRSNKPTGKVLDEFHIDLGQIEKNAKFVPVEVEISPKSIDVAQIKLWVRIFQRSNEEDENGDPDGNEDPNHGTEHTIQWRHNNIFNTVQPYYSATAPEGDVDKKSSLVWTSVNTGPLFGLRINSNIRRLFAQTNKKAAKRMRLREEYVSTDFLDDPEDVIRYISLGLSITSKGRRGLGELTVTVPNNFLFRPYQWVQFIDGLSGISDTLQVQRARYVCNTGGTEGQLGAMDCNITLSGLYNTLLGGCQCV